MELSVLVSILLVISYLVAVGYRRGALPDSMGSVAYVLPDGGWRWLWSVWLGASVFTLTPKLFFVMSPIGQMCAHAFATAMLLLVLLPLMKHEGDKGVLALGTVACLFSQICVALINPWWLLVWLFIPALWLDTCMKGATVERWYSGKGVLVCELLCYSDLAFSLLFA